MIITVKMKDGERQKPIVTIDTETCHYPYAIREAIELALELDGYTKETIGEVFGRYREDCKVKSEPNEAGSSLTVDASKLSRIPQSYNYIHGQGFEAEINGIKCQGNVSLGANGNIYLCQDKKIGADIAEKFGHVYAWYIGAGTEEYLKATGVTNLILYPL